MNLTFDQNLFTQVGLDSGSLTLLGSIVHSFQEPGEYRGSVHKAGGEQAVFYITVDKNSPAAHVNIDLAALQEYSEAPKEERDDDRITNHFTVNPKGYVVFHVSAGSGGFSVYVRRTLEDPNEKVFKSPELGEGDIFSAVILRPGSYSVANKLGKGDAQVTVSYPEIDKAAYRSPAPMRVQVSPRGFEPARLELKPGQGLIFDIKASARIVIELVKADDGPVVDREPPRRRWSKNSLPGTKAE
jgi:hypothetical protein